MTAGLEYKYELVEETKKQAFTSFCSHKYDYLEQFSKGKRQQRAYASVYDR